MLCKMVGLSKDSAGVGGVDKESLVMGAVGGGASLFSMCQDQPPHPPPRPSKVEPCLDLSVLVQSPAEVETHKYHFFLFHCTSIPTLNDCNLCIIIIIRL